MLDLLAIRRDAGLLSNAGEVANPANPANALHKTDEPISQIRQIRQFASPPTDDPVPPGGRELLSLLDVAGPMSVDELALGMAWPTYEVWRIVKRLQGLGFVGRSGDRLRLTAAAERVTASHLGSSDVEKGCGCETTASVDSFSAAAAVVGGPGGEP